MAKKVLDKDGQEFDLEELVKGLVATKGNGDPSKALEVIVQENHELRAKNTSLRTENEDLKGVLPGGKPGQGFVILNADEAKAWKSYTELGKPEEVKAGLAERDTFKTQYNDMAEQQLVQQAASAHGYKPAVLLDLTRSKGMKIEMGELDVQESGKTVKKPAAYVVQQDGSKKPLHEHIETSLGDYIPALRAEAQTQQGGGGVNWINQTPAPKGGQGNTGQDAVSNYLASTYPVDEK